jgi:lysophospholipase L1-like esterase
LLSDGFTRIGFAIPVPASGNQMVMIGDSYVEGGHVPHNYSLVGVGGSNLPAEFANLAGLSTCINKGIGGQTSTQVAARFAADVVALAPAYCTVNCGANDPNVGINKATFLANYTAMLNAAVAADIIPIVVEIMPINNGLGATYLDWNTDLATLVATYPTAILVNAGSYVGNVSGSFYVIKQQYDVGDGVHYNQTGYRQVAHAIADALSPTATIGNSDGEGHFEGLANIIGAGGGGLAWTVRTGAVSIVNGKAIATALDGDGRAIATVPVSTVNLLLQGRMTKGTTGAGIILRYLDNNNYVYCWHNGTNLKLIRRVAGVDQAANINAAATYAADAIIEVHARLTKFRALYNAVWIGAEQTISDADLQTGLHIGAIWLDIDSTINSIEAHPVGNGGEYTWFDRI